MQAQPYPKLHPYRANLSKLSPLTVIFLWFKCVWLLSFLCSVCCTEFCAHPSPAISVVFLKMLSCQKSFLFS